jgi:hypothetical protein
MTSTKQADLPRLKTKKIKNRLLLLFVIRLPIPTLAETSKKYLKTVAPLLNNDEFNETKKVCSREYLF